jgi:hypothetical protein
MLHMEEYEWDGYHITVITDGYQGNVPDESKLLKDCVKELAKKFDLAELHVVLKIED